MRPIPSAISDDQLRAAILAALAAGTRTVADLHVGVLNGIAHLAGKVDSLAKRAVAEEIAQSVVGVRGVVNRIEAPGAPSPARTVHLNLSDQKSRFKEEV